MTTLNSTTVGIMSKLSELQKERLVEFMEIHPEMVSSKFTPTFTFKDCIKLWETIAEKLNGYPGAKKKAVEWRKTWHDLRRVVKEKAAKMLEHSQSQSEEPCKESLTEIQERMYALIEARAIVNQQLKNTKIVMDSEIYVAKNEETSGVQEYETIITEEPGCSNSKPAVISMIINSEGQLEQRQSEPTIALIRKQLKMHAAERRPPKEGEEASKRFCSISEQRLQLKKEELKLYREKLEYDKEKLLLKERGVLAKEATAAALDRIALALEFRNELL